jgi:glutathione S-transferase
MGLVRTPPEQRDPAAIAAGISACEALFAMLDDELAKTPWLSGEQFGLGDIAVAPFVYNLLSILDSWQPRPHLQRWYQQISQRPAWRGRADPGHLRLTLRTQAQQLAVRLVG